MSPQGTGKDILVVEDDPFIRQGLVITLEGAGYTVHQAGNGEEAFRALRAFPPPCAILLDIVMPGMNGWEFLREREEKHPELVGVPVIVFSAACEVAPRMPLPRGVAKVLPKPVRGLEVLASLSDILEAVEQQASGLQGPHQRVRTPDEVTPDAT